MRVEIIDCVNMAHVIDSQDGELIGRWFAEQAPAILSADVRLVSRINVWPQTEAEFALIGKGIQGKLDQDGLLALAQAILDASAKQGELEAAKA